MASQVEPSPSEDHVTQIFEFDDGTFIENLLVLPNGHLLLTTFRSGELMILDPEAEKPKAEIVVDLPGSTGLSGITSVGDGLYAISGGEHIPFAFVEGSMRLYVVSLADRAIVDTIPVPRTRCMNGMTSVPDRPHIVLSVDSIEGRILRVDTRTREVGVAFADHLLGLEEGNGVPLGANGIRIRGEYLYYTNSAQGTFGRVRIDDDGYKTGPFETLSKLEGGASMNQAYDDFAFDNDGNAYVTVHRSWVNKICPDGSQSTFAGSRESTMFKEPTSAALANDGKSVFVCTGGNKTGGGGQIIRIKI